MNGRISLYSVALIAILASCGSQEQASLEVGTSTPGWDGYVVPEVEDVITSAVWDGDEMILAAFERNDGQFSNTVASYDPTVGSWRELPELPSELPVTLNALSAGPRGVVLAGKSCDPARSSDDGDGLTCVPGEVRTFLMPAGEDAFVEVPAPDPSKAAGNIPSLAQGGLDVDPILWVDGVVYRLGTDDRWERLGQDAVGMVICQVGDRLVGVNATQGSEDGAPTKDLLVEFDPDISEWNPIELPEAGSFGTLHCGDGMAWYEVVNEEPALRASYLITAEGNSPTLIDIPSGLLIGSVAFDGTNLVAWATPAGAGSLPEKQAGRLYVLDGNNARLVPATHPRGAREGTVEVSALDGTVVLYGTSSRAEGSDFETSYHVGELPALEG